MTHISVLPEEILLKILLLLSGKDTVLLSRVSSYFYNFLNQENIWRRVLKKENLTISSHVVKLSKTMMEKSSLPQSKLFYLAVEKLHQNWLAGSRNNTRLVTSYDRANTHFRKSENILAFVDSEQTVKVFDLCSKEPSLLDSWNLESEKRISIIFVLESYLVIGYFENFSLSLQTYSLLSFNLVWKSQNTIDCTNLMRSYHQDINSFGDFLAVFRSGSITFYAVGDSCVQQLEVTQDIVARNGIFQYPRFSAFSDNHYVHPFQVSSPSLQDEMVREKHRIHCWTLHDLDNVTVKTLTMETEVDPHSIFIRTAVTETHCYGLLGSHLLTWNIETGELVSQACLQVPGHMICVGDLDVGAGVCCLLLSRQGSTVQKSHLGMVILHNIRKKRYFKSFRLDIWYHNQFTGIFSIDGNLLGKVEIAGELFSITNAKLYIKKVVLERKVLGSKTITVMVADLTTMFEALKMRVEEVETVQPIEAYKWENSEDGKGELFIGESQIVKFSETEGITVSSFWHK